ncbi:MAG: glycerol-3-phosphate 1-O-acyltransferase PlsY [Gammaproteobacteria bacterium]
MPLPDILLILAAYLLGSVSSAILVCRAMGLPDPRTQGSGNPGATNVKRLGGSKAAGLTLAGDMLKGVIPVLVGHALGMDVLTLVLTGAAAFFGHLYPVFFGFRGGKGVATLFGVYLALNWMLGLAVIGTWLLMAKVFRISSLSALIATALSPLYAWLLGYTDLPIAIMAALVAVLWWRHRSNIRKLLSGAEDRIDETEKSD